MILQFPIGSSDLQLSNVHPWFANTTIQDAAGWTADFFENTNVAEANSLPHRPQMYIAETGWPTVCHDSALILGTYV